MIFVMNIVMSLRKNVSKVMMQDKKPESFRNKSGVRQGDTLSSTIFNIMLCCSTEKISSAEITGHILNKTTQVRVVAYVDDIVIVNKNIHFSFKFTIQLLPILTKLVSNQ